MQNKETKSTSEIIVESGDAFFSYGFKPGNWAITAIGLKKYDHFWAYPTNTWGKKEKEKEKTNVIITYKSLSNLGFDFQVEKNLLYYIGNWDLKEIDSALALINQKTIEYSESDTGLNVNENYTGEMLVTIQDHFSKDKETFDGFYPKLANRTPTHILPGGLNELKSIRYYIEIEEYTIPDSSINYIDHNLMHQQMLQPKLPPLK